MKLTIARKLMASYLLLIFTTGMFLYGYLNHTLGDYLAAEITEGLRSEARVARLAAAHKLAALRRDAPAVARDIAAETRARVTIIDRNGTVVGDSEVTAGHYGSLENHANRPEVRDAARKGEGTAIRYSATVKTPMLYVAVPFASAAGEAATLRLALPLSALEKTRAKMQAILAAALTIATVIAICLSSILSQFASRSLRSLAATAARIGKGEYGRRLPVTGSDELGELARVMNDMAVRIEAQLASISVEKNRLDAILRGMGEGLMVTDARGVITMVNPAFRTLLGIGEELEGKALIDIARHPALHAAFKLVVETQKEQVQELVLPLPTDMTLLTHWVPLLDVDGIHGIVAVFHDITDLKKLERVRRDFVANVSHELRTPIAVIGGYTETLLADPQVDPEKLRHFMERIYNHSQRLAALVADLLTLSELESGGTALALTPVTLEGPVRQAVALLEQKARDRQVTVDISGIQGAPRVLADRRRLEQVLINLLDNAVKYTPAHGRVSLAAADNGATVRVSVTDNGIGIPPHDLPRVFERFYRVDTARSRTETGTGTGLGLAIVKHIVQLHGGSVEVASTPGQGSTFSFSLRTGATGDPGGGNDGR